MSEECQQVCGICSQLVTTYYYNITNRSGDVTSVLQTSCDRDDRVCKHAWQQTHIEGQHQTCWYDRNQWASGAKFEKPMHHWNQPALVFTIILVSYL